MMYQLQRKCGLRQRGATLVMALIVLVLIMIIGIVAVGTSNTQFKLASNLQFDNTAMNNAESAVSAAENWLSTGTNFRSTGFNSYASGSTPQLYPVNATASNGPAVVTPLTTSYSTTNAKCVDSDAVCASSYAIQLLSTNNTLIGSNQNVGGRGTTVCNTVNTYQIIGRGIGGRGASKTVTSFYSVLNCNKI